MKNIEKIIEMMKKSNPNIKMDYNFKKSLKNKLEVTSYAKIKNTKNKKINIAKSGFFSLKKDWKNIFEKPNFNFIKLLSPIFIWAFAVFGFMNFYWTDLFISEKWNNFNYEVEKFQEENLSEEKIRPVSEVKIWIQETSLVEKKIENKIKEEKKVIERKVAIPIIQKLSPGTGTDNFRKDEITDTEIIDLLWNGESIEERPVSEAKIWIQETSLSDLVEDIQEIDNFIKFCEDKKWIIKNNICEYWKLKCFKIDFENNKCN